MFPPILLSKNITLKIFKLQLELLEYLFKTKLRIQPISDFKLSLSRIELVIVCCADDTGTCLFNTSFSTDGAEKVGCLVPVFVKKLATSSASFMCY